MAMAIEKNKLCFTILVFLSIHGYYAFTPIDNYLIDCGSSANTTIGDRVFVADASLSTTLKTPANILASTNSSVPSTSSSALYQTARVFTTPSSYSFDIQAHGRHFVRLYFFPFVYQNYNLNAATFSVSTQDTALLTDFKPQAKSAVMREYSVNITADTLILTFSPSGSTSLAFVNAIEVVSVPDNLIVDSAQTVNPRGNYDGLSGQVLETIYRVNVGGSLVLPVNDTLWRTWATDDTFIVDATLATRRSFSSKIQYMQGGASPETAPSAVYSTARELASSNTSDASFNMTWQFNMDASSSYLIRLHFCDIISLAAHDLYFDVYIGNWLVVPDLDLSSITMGSLATAVSLDYVLDANVTPSKLTISIGPSTLAGALPDGILNGLEIMKINGSIGSVALVTQPSSKSNLGIIIGAVLGAIVVAVLLILFLVLRRRKMSGMQDSKTWAPFSINNLISLTTGSKASNGTILSAQNGSLGYRFSFVVLQEATNSFDEDWVIGVGGFGKVYRGVLGDETKVAVKRGNPRSQQGFNEFRTEIELLSRLRHRHLVSLIGYCDEKNEMILVYEYMESGTLKSHLYGSDNPPLSWKQRLEVCIGAARGLHYLHTGSAKAIIHRDVKSANILLDENLLAKVADFGLSKTGPELDQTHVSTAVKGSFGYLDPEYFRRQQLTDKSDVYSYGVVLLEVLCARPVIDPTLPRDMVNLAEWGMKFQKRGELQQIVDPRIAGTIKPESLRKYGETIEKCLADYGVDRPGMGDVLWNLEYILLLQETDSGASEVNSTNHIIELAPQLQNIDMSERTPDEELDNSLVHDLSDVSMSKVFSQLIKSEGR